MDGKDTGFPSHSVSSRRSLFHSWCRHNTCSRGNRPFPRRTLHEPFADKARLQEIDAALILIIYMEGGDSPPLFDETRALLCALVILFQRNVGAIHGLGGGQGVLTGIRSHGGHVVNAELSPAIARAFRVDRLDVDRERVSRRKTVFTQGLA